MIMPQTLRNARAKQSSQKEQVDTSSTSFLPRRSTRAVTSEDPEFRNTGFGSSKFARGLRLQSTEPAPRNLELYGYLYQRVGPKLPNKSSGPLLEAPSKTPQPITRKRKRDSKMPRKTMFHESPEPQSESSSESPQPMDKKRKRKPNMLREIQPHNQSPERRPEAVLESTRRMTRTQKRNLKMLCEIQLHNKSPEPRSETASETPQPIARGSSQPVLQKRKHQSNMLRELEAFNESPEGDSEPDIEMLDDPRGHLTRSARHDLINLSKNRPLSPRKNMNLTKLMLAEFSGMPKGTKTFYAEDYSDVGVPWNRRQPESGERVVIKIEEDDKEEHLVGDIDTSGWKHPRSKSTRGTMRSQLGGLVGRDERNEEVASESSWSVWDSEKDQSALTT